jgi:hypothetical protein
MNIEQMQRYRGYSITGSAQAVFGQWRSMVTVRKALFRTEAIAIAPLCDSSAQAVSQALTAARAMVDSLGFELERADDSKPPRHEGGGHNE